MEAGLRLRNFSGEVGCCVPMCEKMPHALQSGIAQSLSGRHLGRSFEAVTSMTRWIYHFYQYLAIYNNGHLSNTSIIIGPCRSKILPSTKLTLQKLPKTLNFQPKWRNLAKSGHTGRDRGHGGGQLSSFLFALFFERNHQIFNIYLLQNIINGLTDVVKVKITLTSLTYLSTTATTTNYNY